MTEEQREFLFKHPWFLKLFPKEERFRIIASYTKEQQLNMLTRYDLELKYGKFKKKMNKNLVYHTFSLQRTFWSPIDISWSNKQISTLVL